MSCLQSPPQRMKDLTVVAIFSCYPFRTEEVPAVGTPPAPRLCPPQVGPNLLASLCLQKLSIQNRAAGRPRSSREPPWESWDHLTPELPSGVGAKARR